MATIALPRFLEKLRTITETTPPNIASWSADGRQYEIHSPRFETEVLTQHFDAKRSLLSFIRQLNYYGFKKLEHKGCEWAISHPKFQRDAPHLIYEIKRKTRKEHIVTASKDEVQSIRTEVGIMKATLMNEIESLRSQIYFLQNQLSRYMHATSQLPPTLMPYTDFDRIRYKPEVPPVSSKPKRRRSGDKKEQKKKRKRSRNSHPVQQLPSGSSGHTSSSSGGAGSLGGSNSGASISAGSNGTLFTMIPK